MTSHIPPDTLRSLYSTMLVIRYFEEKVADVLVGGAEIKCPVHLYTGQEAVAAGVCAHLRKEDYVFSTHRSHGHYLAKGGDLKALAAELFGRATGCSRGRGGSMHLASPELGLPGSSAIVGGTIPLAVGAALAFQLQGKDNVAVAFFGDGATNEGVFYESLNFAALKKLPVIFVCENNCYSTHMPTTACLADPVIYRKAEAFNLPGIRIDGNDVIEVYTTAGKAIEAARQGDGPTLVECLTYRWRGHVGPNYDVDKGLRRQEELDSWIERCPIKTLEELLLVQQILTPVEKSETREAVEHRVTEALAFGREASYPSEGEVIKNVFKK
ncbi:MAG: thiamine pyrophosphate-dependent dehydrogenase E1 component subunit alpha [Chloroflexota bacterium]